MVYDVQVSSAEVLADLGLCQSDIHKWGEANQVVFETSKESFHILHPKHPHGGPFKMLGIHFDT